MENYLRVLKEAQEQLISNDRTVAVKDLAFCHRKKVFSIIDPAPMTEEELYGYISGQAAHDVIGRLFRMFPNRFRMEMEVYYGIVRGKVDVYDKLYNCVIDIKTSSSQKILLKPFKFHEEQVRYYMAIQDSEDGVVIYFMNSIYGKYRVFPIYMTAQERNAQLEKLKLYATSLLKAIEVGDPSLAKGIYDDNEIKWLCNKCPYLEKCKVMRNPSTNAAGAS
jgi:CRISPR/Cas system-associated exonuclease Cas4 (RecB family)